MKAFVGELIGTFVLTLFGCGSVAVAVLFGEYGSIFQIALVWGIGVTLAIYLTRHLSCAHLNPAVTVAMVLSKRMKADKLLSYLLAQFAGAFLAGAVLYGLLAPTISAYELAHGIVRGTEARSIQLVCSVSSIRIPAIVWRLSRCLWRWLPRGSARSCW
mgnify:CR=1 FL=1